MFSGVSFQVFSSTCNYNRSSWQRCPCCKSSPRQLPIGRNPAPPAFPPPGGKSNCLNWNLLKSVSSRSWPYPWYKGGSSPPASPSWFPSSQSRTPSNGKPFYQKHAIFFSFHENNRVVSHNLRPQTMLIMTWPDKTLNMTWTNTKLTLCLFSYPYHRNPPQQPPQNIPI